MRRTHFKNPFTLSLLSLALLSAARLDGQEQVEPEAESGKATLFWDSKDSRGPRWDLSEEPGLFLYIEQLKLKRPNDKVVYIARGPLGEVAWYLLAIKDWLINIGGTKGDLVFTFDGGREKELRYQAWLVPEGAAMPQVAGPPPEDENAVIEFTDFPYADVCEYCRGKARLTLEALVEGLKKRPQRKAYLEFFPCSRGVAGRRLSAARHEALEAKKILIDRGGVAPSRILMKMKTRGEQRCKARIWLLPSHLNSLRK